MAGAPGHVDELPAFYQAKRDLFCGLLGGSRWRALPAAGTYFQLLDYSAIRDVDDVTMAGELVSAHGVAAIPVSVFCERPPHLRLLRFCFAKQDETLVRAAELLCRI
jgi:methionine aminotransferase